MPNVLSRLRSPDNNERVKADRVQGLVVGWLEVACSLTELTEQFYPGFAHFYLNRYIRGRQEGVNTVWVSHINHDSE